MVYLLGFVIHAWINTAVIGLLYGLTKHAVQGAHEDVVLLGDGGGKHSRCV